MWPSTRAGGVLSNNHPANGGGRTKISVAGRPGGGAAHPMGLVPTGRVARAPGCGGAGSTFFAANGFSLPPASRALLRSRAMEH